MRAIVRPCAWFPRRREPEVDVLRSPDRNNQRVSDEMKSTRMRLVAECSMLVRLVWLTFGAAICPSSLQSFLLMCIRLCKRVCVQEIAQQGIVTKQRKLLEQKASSEREIASFDTRKRALRRDREDYTRLLLAANDRAMAAVEDVRATSERIEMLKSEYQQLEHEKHLKYVSSRSRRVASRLLSMVYHV